MSESNESIISCTVVQTKTLSMTIYSNTTGDIFTREKASTQKIAENASGSLSVNLSADGEIYVFYQNAASDIMLLHFDGASWKKQVIQKNLSGTIYNLKIFSIVTKDSIHLLYNIPTEADPSADEKGYYKIVSQEMNSGKWLPHTTIAERVKDSPSVFSVQPIPAGNDAQTQHFTVYYYTETGETHFGYKEIYLPNSRNGFAPLHSSLYTFADMSVATTKDGIHAVFVMRGVYSCQLIYKSKLGQTVNAPIMIFEANRIESAALSVIGEAIQVIFSAGGYGFFKTVSTDGGKTFSRPQRVRPEAKGKVIKAEYLCDSRYISEAFVYDVYTDAENPGAVLFHEKSELCSYTESPPEKSLESPVGSPVPGAEQLSEHAERVSILENRLHELRRELAEKNRQIVELTAMNSGKNHEIASVAASFRETIKRLSEQSAEKDRLILRLRDELLTAKAQASPVAEGEPASVPINTEAEQLTIENRLL